MSEYRDKGAKATRQASRRQQYPPPRDTGEYSRRPLPRLPSDPPRPKSASSSVYDSEEPISRQSTPRYQAEDVQQKDPRQSTFAGALDADALAMVKPLQLSTANIPQHEQEQALESPQPRRPEVRFSEWLESDDYESAPLVEEVSPVSPGDALASMVSPLTPASGFGTFPVNVTEASTSSETGTKHQSLEPSCSGMLSTHPPYNPSRLRYSDPGSPTVPASSCRNFGEPGPDVGGPRRVENSSMGHREQSGRVPSSHGKERPMSTEQNRVSFSTKKIDSFSSIRPSGTAPPPLTLKQRAVGATYVKTPFPPMPNSDSSQNSSPKTDTSQQDVPVTESSSQVEEPIEKTFEAMDINFQEPKRASYLDRSAPKVKDIFSRAKQGLRLGNEEAKKEKRRQALKSQIRLSNGGEIA
ncbi:hypothetical protein GGR57DRAFT_499759 [Xylariaceae sp. FL1272]|nr:hypothetical protein GGR57DRAFT_499759 [Xylariaceae sp. FL1272]